MVESVNERERSPIEALFDNFVELIRDGSSALLGPWLAIALVDFGFVAIATLSVVAFGTAEAGTAGAMVVQIVGIVQGLAILTLRVALLNTLRDVAFGGPEAISSFGSVVRDIGDRLLSSFLIALALIIIVSVGFALCVLPGLVALFFLAFAPYLVAARGFGIGESLAESARWASRQWPLLLSAIAIAVIAGGLMACTMGVFSTVADPSIVAVPFGLVGGWLVNTIIGYLAFVWWGAVYVTAETTQQLETFRKTSPRDTGDRRQPPRERGGGADTSIYRVPEDRQ